MKHVPKRLAAELELKTRQAQGLYESMMANMRRIESLNDPARRKFEDYKMQISKLGLEQLIQQPFKRIPSATKFLRLESVLNTNTAGFASDKKIEKLRQMGFDEMHLRKLLLDAKAGYLKIETEKAAKI